MSTDQTPKPLTPSALKRRVAIYGYVAQMILDGLKGKPFSWGDGARRAWTPFAADMGMTLVTKTSAARLGYQLKRGAKPVGHAYFGAPIKVTAALYVLECQCVPMPQAYTTLNIDPSANPETIEALGRAMGALAQQVEKPGVIASIRGVDEPKWSPLEKEIAWCQSHRNERGNIPEFETGFIAGLQQALAIERKSIQALLDVAAGDNLDRNELLATLKMWYRTEP